MPRRSSAEGTFLALLIGAVLGSIAGYLIGYFEPLAFLSQGRDIGFNPVALDLSVMKVTIGLQLRISLGTITGMLLSFIIQRNS